MGGGDGLPLPMKYTVAPAVPIIITNRIRAMATSLELLTPAAGTMAPDCETGYGAGIDGATIMGPEAAGRVAAMASCMGAAGN
jgi:hypothetical protein